MMVHEGYLYMININLEQNIIFSHASPDEVQSLAEIFQPSYNGPDW